MIFIGLKDIFGQSRCSMKINCTIILINVLTRLSNGHVYHRDQTLTLWSFSIYWIFHECRGWLVCGYLIFCEVVLRPESDVVSDICINHVLTHSHFSRGMDGRGEGSYVVVVSTYIYMPTKMGQFFKPSFHPGGFRLFMERYLVSL